MHDTNRAVILEINSGISNVLERAMPKSEAGTVFKQFMDAIIPDRHQSLPLAGTQSKCPRGWRSARPYAYNAGVRTAETISRIRSFQEAL